MQDITYLTSAIDELGGMSPFIKSRLRSLVGSRIIDLLFHLPVYGVERHSLQQLHPSYHKKYVTIPLKVEDYQKSGPPSPLRVSCVDRIGTPIHLIFFNARLPYIRKQLPVGQERWISGKLEVFQGSYQISHPDFIGFPSQASLWQGCEPVYPLTSGVSNKTLRRLICSALSNIPSLCEWYPENVGCHFPSWREALLSLHQPTSPQDLLENAPSRHRLIFDEFLAHQLSLRLARAHRSHDGIAFVTRSALREAFISQLPFKLTSGQQQALQEIDQDMASKKPMARLVQGDVGCGKTVVALIAMLNAIATQKQAALLAPTEILARQHFNNIKKLLDPLPIKVDLILGHLPARLKAPLLQKLATGETQLIVGTHALLEEEVDFHALGLVVIDEQHRFGVKQRQKLIKKGQHIDALVMSATPIPRTLAMTQYGDLDISKIKDKPEGRQPITTSVLPIHRLPLVLERLQHAIDKGAKAYWVCPLVEESESIDLAAATSRYEELSSLFPDQIGLIHGRMKAEDKDEVMEHFIKGHYTILVSTTVIEVGVDVKDANIMIIEQAERFGLAQLHQLRGRVGRGTQTSSCLLLHSPNITEISYARLNIMRATNDGFLIAEEDLKIRGSGNIAGVQQSGNVLFRLGDPVLHHDLLLKAHQCARQIIEEDQVLSLPKHASLKTLLALYDYMENLEDARSLAS